MSVSYYSVMNQFWFKCKSKKKQTYSICCYCGTCWIDMKILNRLHYMYTIYGAAWVIFTV
jgi:hypothetical protein